jgi:acylphosphatase
MKTIKAIVSGKVQGVSYRMYKRQEARQLGVRGYVRNLSSGDVEVVFTSWYRKLQIFIVNFVKLPIV